MLPCGAGSAPVAFASSAAKLRDAVQNESNDSTFTATWVSELHAGEQVFIRGVAGAGDFDFWKMEFMTDSTVWFVWGGGHVQIRRNGVNLGRFPVCDWVNSPLNVGRR